MALQEALAYVLVNDETRAALLDSPKHLQAQFGLTDDEVELLRSANPSGLTLSARSIRGKRVDFLTRALPCTMNFLHANGMGDLLLDFVRTSMPVNVADDLNRLLAEGRRFVEYLLTHKNDHLPEGLGDLAVYELLRAELSASKEASAWAEYCARQSAYVHHLVSGDASVLDTVPLQIGRHVRLYRSPCDVITLANSQDERKSLPKATFIPTTVLLKKAHNRVALDVYRIGDFVYEILKACNGQRSISDLCLMLTLKWLSQAELKFHAAQAVRFALARGIIMPVVPGEESKSCASVHSLSTRRYKAV